METLVYRRDIATGGNGRGDPFYSERDLYFVQNLVEIQEGVQRARNNLLKLGPPTSLGHRHSY